MNAASRSLRNAGGTPAPSGPVRWRRRLKLGALGLLGTLLLLVAVFITGGLLLAPQLPPADPAAPVPAPAIDTAPGSGRPTLILLHGAALNAHMWDPVIRQLDHTRWRVIAIDLPGHGARGHEAYTLAAATRAVADAAQRAAPAPVVLAGDSLGGYTALAAAAQLPPAQLKGLVVAGAAGDIPARLGVRDTATRFMFRWLLALRDERVLAPAALARFGVQAADAQPMLDAGVHLAAVELSVDALAGVPFKPTLAAIARPVLLLNGEHDPGHTTEEDAYVQAGRCTAARHYLGVGHGISMLRATQFARDLDRAATAALAAPDCPAGKAP